MTERFATSAELATWEALARGARPVDAVLPSIRVTDELGDHEGDLVVGLAGAGIAVIEVKGGRVTHDGTTWVQHGGRSKPIDPVEQARRAKYALRDYLDGLPAWGRRRVRMVHLVALPYSRVASDFSLPDCPRWMVLDKGDLAGDPLGRVWDALARQGTDAPPASEADVRDLVECVRGVTRPPADGGVASSPFGRAGRRWVALAAAAAALAVLAIGAAWLAWGRGPAVQPARGLVAPTSEGQLDPRFATCLQARVAGYGRYVRGRDPEYAWYRDLDGDGIVCE